MTSTPDTGAIALWTKVDDLDRMSSVRVSDGVWHSVGIRRVAGLLSVWMDGTETRLDVGTSGAARNQRHFFLKQNGFARPRSRTITAGIRGPRLRGTSTVPTPCRPAGAIWGDLGQFTLYRFAFTDEALSA